MGTKPSASAVVAVAGVLLIALFLGLILFGVSGVDLGNQAFQDKSFRGYYAFYRLLEELDYKVAQERADLPPPDGDGTVLYLDDQGEALADAKEMRRWIRRGNTLVLIGEAAAAFSEDAHLKAVEEAPMTFPAEEWAEFDGLAASQCLPEEFFQGKKTGRALAAVPGGVVIGEVLLGQGRVLYIADRGLFANEGLRNSQQAYMLSRLFAPLREGPLFLRERSPEVIQAPSVARQLFGGKAGYAGWHGALVFLLFLLFTGKRFARPDRAEASEKRRISQHLRAVGVFYRSNRAYGLIDRIDREYFKTVVCRNRRPPELSAEEFRRASEAGGSMDRDAVWERFALRARLTRRIREKG